MYLIYSICQHSQGPMALSVCVCVVYYIFLFIEFCLNSYSEFSDYRSLSHILSLKSVYASLIEST
jgi:hypothetical protein